MGRAEEEYCFRASGLFAARLTTEGGTVTDSGTYRYDGATLFLRGENGSFAHDVQFDGGNLILNGATSDAARRFRRVSRHCE